MIVKYIIVDDEPIAHDIIKGYCDLMSNMQLMKHCYDAIEALAFLNEQEINLIFLDLNMPKLKGFDFLKTLSNPPKVIVTTAYSEYALEGYELDIVDYLLKPFSFERFLKAVNKALVKPKENHSTKLSSSSAPVPKEGRLFLYTDKKYFQIVLDDLMYVEAAGNYTKVVLKEEIITIREQLTSVLDRLPAEDFVQVHRSFLVSIKQIKSIQGNEIFLNQNRIPIGKLYKAKLIDLLQ
jgi:Response regulator of the LytR/AlgR family